MKVFTDAIKFLLKSIVLMFLLLSCNKQGNKNDFFYPADFDPVNSTCFIWTDEFF